MNHIKPEDIQKASFHTGPLGYKKDEVDGYLEELAVSTQGMWREIDELKLDIAEQAERINNYRNLEEDLKNTFILAQQSAGEIRENAVKESELLIKENEMKVEKILLDGQKEIDEMEVYYAQLKRKVTNHKTKMKADLRTLLDILEEDAEEQD